MELISTRHLFKKNYRVTKSRRNLILPILYMKRVEASKDGTYNQTLEDLLSMIEDHDLLSNFAWSWSKIIIFLLIWSWSDLLNFFLKDHISFYFLCSGNSANWYWGCYHDLLTLFYNCIICQKCFIRKLKKWPSKRWLWGQKMIYDLILEDHFFLKGWSWSDLLSSFRRWSWSDLLSFFKWSFQCLHIIKTFYSNVIHELYPVATRKDPRRNIFYERTEPEGTSLCAI
jgi:hypothetical protein